MSDEPKPIDVWWNREPINELACKPKEQTDSREKIEADAVKMCHMHTLRARPFLDLLDRQAAVTERELCGRCSPYATAKDYMDTIDSLTAERDELKAFAERLETASRDKLGVTLFGVNYVTEEFMLHVQDELIAEMTAERDEWKSGFKSMCDTRDELTAERDELKAKVDELNASWRKANDGWAEANAEAERWRQERDRLQRVVKVQADSFAKIERENRELQDACGELERTIENMRVVE